MNKNLSILIVCCMAQISYSMQRVAVSGLQATAAVVARQVRGCSQEARPTCPYVQEYCRYDRKMYERLQAEGVDSLDELLARDKYKPYGGALNLFSVAVAHSDVQAARKILPYMNTRLEYDYEDSLRYARHIHRLHDFPVDEEIVALVHVRFAGSHSKPKESFKSLLE